MKLKSVSAQFIPRTKAYDFIVKSYDKSLIDSVWSNLSHIEFHTMFYVNMYHTIRWDILNAPSIR